MSKRVTLYFIGLIKIDFKLPETCGYFEIDFEMLIQIDIFEGKAYLIKNIKKNCLQFFVIKIISSIFVSS